MATVSFVHAERDSTFSFHVANGELVEITSDKPFKTSDQGLIAYLDTVRFVKRAGKATAEPSGGEEA